MRFFAVEVIIPESGTTNLMIFSKRWQANEMYHYLAGFGNNVYKWEL